MARTDNSPWEIELHEPTYPGDPKYYSINTTIDGNDAEIVDTLNSSHLISVEEQREYVERIVRAVNAHDDMLAACEIALEVVRQFGVKEQDCTKGGVAFTMLRQAIAKAKS